jgi:hypothetical protein
MPPDGIGYLDKEKMAGRSIGITFGGDDSSVLCDTFILLLMLMLCADNNYMDGILRKR